MQAERKRLGRFVPFLHIGRFPCEYSEPGPGQQVKGLKGNEYILLEHTNAFVFYTTQIPLQGFLLDLLGTALPCVYYRWLFLSSS